MLARQAGLGSLGFWAAPSGKPGRALSNSGDIGYLLNETEDEYPVVSNDISLLLNTTSQNGLSPTKPFSQIAGRSAGRGAVLELHQPKRLANLPISPLPATTDWISS